jgi:acetyl/propionyl-CoA carboxylase alpha subunit
MPAGPGVRVDTATEAGDRVPAEYDNLIAKVMVHGGDRAAAIARLCRALDETEIAGIQTTLPFHRFVARADSFEAADISTGWVDEHWDGAAAMRRAARTAQLAAGLAALSDGLAGGSSGISPTADGPEHVAAGDDPRPGWRDRGLAIAIDRWPT